ncbi:hypothetical protein BU14_2922s0001, partial [Porphyra umbilicalis]
RPRPPPRRADRGGHRNGGGGHDRRVRHGGRAHAVHNDAAAIDVKVDGAVGGGGHGRRHRRWQRPAWGGRVAAAAAERHARGGERRQVPPERVCPPRQLPHEGQHVGAEVLAKHRTRVRHIVEVGVVALPPRVVCHVQPRHPPHLVEDAPVRFGGHEVGLKNVHGRGRAVRVGRRRRVGAREPPVAGPTAKEEPRLPVAARLEVDERAGGGGPPVGRHPPVRAEQHRLLGAIEQHNERPHEHVGRRRGVGDGRQHFKRHPDRRHIVRRAKRADRRVDVRVEDDGGARGGERRGRRARPVEPRDGVGHVGVAVDERDGADGGEEGARRGVAAPLEDVPVGRRRRRNGVEAPLDAGHGLVEGGRADPPHFGGEGGHGGGGAGATKDPGGGRRGDDGGA